MLEELKVRLVPIRTTILVFCSLPNKHYKQEESETQWGVGKLPQTDNDVLLLYNSLIILKWKCEASKLSSFKRKNI